MKEIIVYCNDGVEFGSRELGFRHWLLADDEKAFTILTRSPTQKVAIDELGKNRFRWRPL